MMGELALALGAIASFCEGVGVEQVRILQCDTAVERDELVDVDRLAHFEIGGFGGSNMSPALERMADDPEVEAAVVLTDGYIDYPASPMPYLVLWVLTSKNAGFRPPYGQVIALPGAERSYNVSLGEIDDDDDDFGLLGVSDDDD